MQDRHLTAIKLQGFTLVELMVAVAILAVITAIAVPAYNGYIREAQFGAARANADSLRVFMEDFFLENGTYNAGGGSPFSQGGGNTDLNDNFGWSPDGDQGTFTYTVTADATSWSITAEHTSGRWIRCERRMQNCCDSDTTGATTTACP